MNTVQENLIGNIILLATGIVWAFYNFVTRKIVNKYSTLVITFYQTVAGAVAFIPLMLFEHKQWQMPSMNSIFALSYLVIFCSVLGFLLYAFGLKQLNSSTAVTLMNLVPVFGVLFSILLLHESVNFIQLLGGFIIIAGIIISIQQVKN